MSGTVAGSTKHSISVVFAAAGTVEEILIPVGPAATFKGVARLDDIKKDDVVKVEYKKPAEGKIQALTITLMKAAAETEFNRKPTIERVKAEDKKKEPQEK